jgi:hypothetical protein
VDNKSGWWKFGILFDYNIDFNTQSHSPTPPTSFHALPSNYGVASFDQASPSNSVGTTEIDPLLLFLFQSPAEAGSHFSTSFPPFPTSGPSPSDLSFLSFAPSSEEPSPTAAPHRPHRIAKRERKHACPHTGCLYSCALPKDLRKHILIHSPPTTECPNKPNGCGQVFRREDHAERHAVNSCQFKFHQQHSDS